MYIAMMDKVDLSQKPKLCEVSPHLTFMTATLARHATNNSKIIVTLMLGVGFVSLIVNHTICQIQKEEIVLRHFRVRSVEATKAGHFGAGDNQDTINRNHHKDNHKTNNALHHEDILNVNNEAHNEGHRFPRILCWVMTHPANHQKIAIHVKKTWSKRCDKTIFMSSQNDTELGAVALPGVGEGRSNLWPKTRAAFFYLWKNHRDDADWFIKADDDTYLIVENLRHFLSKQDSAKPIYHGCHFKPFGRYKNGYMSGGAGYVLSKEAVRLFAEKSESSKCFGNPTGSEDAEMGKCLEDIGVVPADSRDKLRRHRFMPFLPDYHMDPEYMPPDLWYWNLAMHPHKKEGRECCSDTAVSFHYASPADIHTLEYFIYGVKSRLAPCKSTLYNRYHKQITTVA